MDKIKSSSSFSLPVIVKLPMYKLQLRASLSASSHKIPRDPNLDIVDTRYILTADMTSCLFYNVSNIHQMFEKHLYNSICILILKTLHRQQRINDTRQMNNNWCIIVFACVGGASLRILFTNFYIYSLLRVLIWLYLDPITTLDL